MATPVSWFSCMHLYVLDLSGLQMASWMHILSSKSLQWTGTLQEFRYGSMGISVLAGGCLFDREKRGFTTRTRSGQATLCLESPADPSPMAVDHLVSVEIHVGQCSVKASIHSQDFSPRHRHWSTGLQDWHHPCSFQSWIPRSFDPVSLQGSREQWYQSDISRDQTMARLLVFFFTHY